MKANILSFAEMESKYNVTYVPQEGFIVYFPELDFKFVCRDKLYTTDWQDTYVVLWKTMKQYMPTLN